jgi:hypothetical protein
MIFKLKHKALAISLLIATLRTRTKKRANVLGTDHFRQFSAEFRIVTPERNHLEIGT